MPASLARGDAARQIVDRRSRGPWATASATLVVTMDADQPVHERARGSAGRSPAGGETRARIRV